MKLTFLGTGTSQGIPVIGCSCNVCTSNDIRNHRYRPSVLLEIDGTIILIDASNELRLQMLNAKIKKLDGVLITHSHFDHISGINDIREFNFIQRAPVDIYGNSQTLEEIKITFRYAFSDNVQKGGGLPKLNLKTVNEQNFFINDVEITPIEVKHGDLDILGFRIKNFAYITDSSFIPEESFNKLNDLELLVLNTLRYKPHPTHFNLEQSVATTKRIKAKRTYFTHICHDLEHNTVNEMLPEGIQLAYDNLTIEI